MPSAPRNGDANHTPAPRARGIERGDDFPQDRRVHYRIAHDATASEAGAARFVLRLHEQDEVGAGAP